jgi:hypothetical protein
VRHVWRTGHSNSLEYVTTIKGAALSGCSRRAGLPAHLTRRVLRAVLDYTIIVLVFVFVSVEIHGW